VSWQWSHIHPFGISTWGKYLKPAEPVEKYSDASEVGVLAQGCTTVVDGLGRRLDKSYLVTTNALQSMDIGQSPFR
jgi:hypothetical protein